MWRILLLLVVALLGYSTAAEAQGRRKERKKTETQIEDAHRRAAEQETEIDTKLAERREKHMTIQTKATQKRMKKNRKKAERMSRGADVPFYKRWFRKRHFR
jgi:hypothetical protein